MIHSSVFSQFSSAVLAREILKEKIFRLTLSSSFVAKKAKPGNFVHIKVGSDDYPLLRRAFSIHGVRQDNQRFDILFKVVGKGTEILSKATPGDTLDILGPIGNSFSLPRAEKNIMLVAGGMGIAPLWFLFTQLIKRVKRDKLTFFIGAKNKKELLYVEKLKMRGVRLVVTTDDGSLGRKGLVTDIFLEEIRRRDVNHQNLAIYSCGPQMMLERMSDMAKRFDLFCQISLETHMPCGVGACWGCVVKLKDGSYKRVCVDGPVFDARKVDLNQYKRAKQNVIARSEATQQSQ
jgi:dihydroorotate dehydrogenase electron transfer subunit